MVLFRWLLLFCLLWRALLPSALAAEPDWGDVKPLPIPAELQGLWARGRHCNDPRRQLRITNLTMQFGNHKPVRSYYMRPDDVIRYGGIVPDIDQPGPAAMALTYAEGLDVLFDYGNDFDPERLYYRCPTRKPRGH